MQIICQTGHINTIVNSILSLPWLCLEMTSEETNPFVQAYYSFIRRDKAVLRGCTNPVNGEQNEKSIPYLDMTKRTNGFNKRSSSTQTLCYYMDLKICHPISDKPFQTLSYGSEFIADHIANEYHSGFLTYCDQVKVTECQKNFLGSKDILVPELAFIVHITMFITKLNRKKTYSCLVYSPEKRKGGTLESDTSDFLVCLSIDEECIISLMFKETTIDNTTELGVSAIEKLFPSQEDLKSHEGFSLRRFTLQKAHCELYLSVEDLHHAEQQNFNHFQNDQIPQNQNPDSYTINNTQNNFYFNDHQNRRHNGQNSNGPNYQNGPSSNFYTNSHNQPMNPTAWNTRSSNQSESFLFGQGNQFRESEHSENATRPTGNQSESGPSMYNKNWFESNSSQVGDKAFKKKIVLENASQEQESLNSSSESDQVRVGSSDKNQDSVEQPTDIEILSDPKLLKKYSNSKSKNNFIHNLVSSIEEANIPLLMGTLKPVIKDICKNKYGNYAIQVIARSLPSKYMEEFLMVLSPHLIQVICHPKGTFVVQGIISVLKEVTHQKMFISLLHKDINKLLKNKEGSYIIKELYRIFDPSLLEIVNQVFMDDFQKNISDKYSICIFKEIAIRYSSDRKKLDDLLKEFTKYFQEFKINTFYHFGIQYFIEVYRI